MDDIKKGPGGAVSAAFQKAEEYLKGEVIQVVEPDTGLTVPAYLSAHGVSPVPDSVFDPYRLTPKHRDDKATLFDLDSLIAYANRFKDKESALFANNSRQTPSLTVILDYHPTGKPGEAGRFGNHRGAFNFPLSDEWRIWTGQSGQKMSMVDFAHFLEDHIIDVLSTDLVSIADDDAETKRFFSMMGGQKSLADPARLLEIASNLQINEASAVVEAVKLSSGEGEISFKAEHETTSQGAKISVPKMFALGIPVFKNGEAYRVFARLRYRKEAGGSISFSFELWRTDRVFDHAFDEAVAKAASETDLPVFLGRDNG